MKKSIYTFTLLFILFLGGPTYVYIWGNLNFKGPLGEQDRSSANLANNKIKENDSIVQIYAARAYNWKGAFAVHCWISTKEKHEKEYIVYQGLDWNKDENKPIVDVRKDIPDRNWFGNKPIIIFEAKGIKAEKIIAEIKNAVNKYPYPNEYCVWPGPNSNTFIAYVIRNSPSINIRLPVTAIGKDFLRDSYFRKSISNSGYQFSLGGLLGFTLAKKEGLEINLLSFSFSLNKDFPFFHIPGID